ncbi:MAG: hypothetical protein ACYDC6_12385 [Acidobacteriaceae bacterium]
MNHLWSMVYAERGEIGVAVLWVWSRLRSSMPTMGTPSFYKVWAYDFLQGYSAKKDH